jgi:hypothetical protein
MFSYSLNFLYNLSNRAYNLPNMTINYLENKFIEFYNSILIQPQEEIEMEQIDANKIIIIQPCKLKIH